MSTKTIPLILIFSFLASLAWADDKKPKKIDLSEAYQDAKHAFRFQYPEDWTLTAGAQPRAMGAYLIVAGQPVDNFAPNFNIVLAPADNQLTSVTEESLQKQLESIFRNLNIKKFEIKKFLGKDAIFVHYTAVMGESARLEIIQYMFNHKDKCIVLTFTDSADHFKESAPVFKAMADSFMLK